MAIEAARLVAIVEVQNADAAARQLQNFGAQIDKAGQSAQRSGGGFAVLDKHALNASQRAQVAGTNFAAMGRGVDTAGKQAATAGTSMAKAGDGATKAGTGAQKATGFFGGFREQMVGANAASIAASAGMVGLAAGVGMAANAAVSAGINYESAFAGVAKTVDATESELDSLSISIRNMATEIPVAATEIAGIAEAAGALGVAKGDILEFTETAALIGVTTDVSSDQAATSLGQLSNVLNLTADDYERFGSTLVDLGNQGASTESAILGIASRSGAASELIGMATEETLAWGSAVANLGIEAEAGGSSLQTFFISTAKMVAETGAELEILAETAGMTGEAFATMFADDSSAALQTFISGLGELDQAQQLATLSALGFNDVRISRTLLGLASNTDNLTSSLKTAEQGWRENTAMAEEAEKRFDTTASKLTILKNQATDAAISGFDVLGPAIGGTTELLGDFVVSLPPAIEGLADFISEAQKIGSGEAAPDHSSFEGFFGFIIGQAGQAEDALNGINDWINDLPSLELFPQSAETGPAPGIGQTLAADIMLYVESLTAQRDAQQAAGEGLQEFSTQSERAGQTFVNTAQVIRDSQQAMGEGFTDFSTQSELAASHSTVSFDRFATAFQGNVEMATSSIGEIAIAASSGAVDFEDAMGLYAGIPRDVLVPAVTEAAAELRGKLADATLSEEDARAIQGQVNALKAIFPELVAEIDGVAGAFGNFGAIQDQFQANIALAGEGVSEWQGHLSGAETALGFLQDKLDNGVALTDREIEQYDILTGAVDRYTGGINDEAQALVDAEVAKAEFIGKQDELNQALADGKITQDEYNSAIAEAAGGLDPLTAGQVGLAEATSTVIDKLRDFMIELGLIPPDVETDLVVDDADANLTLDQYMDKYGTMPDPPPTAVTADTAGAQQSINDYAGAVTGLPDSSHTSVTADVQSAIGAVQSLINMVTATRVMPVVVSSAGGFTPFADGGISQGGLALVGEEGPEFVVLPKGAEVITAPETMALMAGMPWLGGFAAGTGNQSMINANSTAQMDVSGFEQVGLNIGNQIQAGIIAAFGGDFAADLLPAANQIADAMIEGAVVKVESEIEGIPDSFEVNAGRIPELAAGIGQETAMALMESYVELQGQLQLAILSGDDQTEIRAQLAAIEALLAAWGQSVIGTAESVGDALAEAAQAASFGDIFSDLMGDLEGVFSGERAAALNDEWDALWDQHALAIELGLEAEAAAIQERMNLIEQELAAIGQVVGSEVGAGMAAGFEAEQIAAEWDQRMEDALSGPSFGAGLQAGIDELQDKIDMGPVMDVPASVIGGWESEKADIEQQAANYWWDVANAAAAGLIDEETLAAYAEAGGEQFAAYLEALVGEEAAQQMLDGITQMTDASIGQIQAAFDAAPEMAAGFIDDIVMGVNDGRFDVSQAFGLLASIPRDEMLPVLDDLEKKWTVDLVQAIVDGNLEAEASLLQLLETLGLIREEINATNAAWDGSYGWTSEKNNPGSSQGIPNLSDTLHGGSRAGGDGSSGSSAGGDGSYTYMGKGVGAYIGSDLWKTNPEEWKKLIYGSHNPSAILGLHYGTILEKYGIPLWNTSGTEQGREAIFAQVVRMMQNNHPAFNDPAFVKALKWWRYYPSQSKHPRDQIAADREAANQALADERAQNRPGYHAMAMGGVINEPLLALMGEAGREAVVPLEGRGAQQVAEALVKAMRDSGLGTWNHAQGPQITIHAPDTRPATIANAVQLASVQMAQMLRRERLS